MKQPSSKFPMISFLLPTAGSVSILLPDLFAAFDTINHAIILHWLQSIGISGTALHWLISYLTDRYHLVFVNNSKFYTCPVSHGVPQGQVLEPILFMIYMLPLGQIIPHLKHHFRCFADNTQLYISTKSMLPVAIHRDTTILLFGQQQQQQQQQKVQRSAKLSTCNTTPMSFTEKSMNNKKIK